MLLKCSAFLALSFLAVVLNSLCVLFYLAIQSEASTASHHQHPRNIYRKSIENTTAVLLARQQAAKLKRDVSRCPNFVYDVADWTLKHRKDNASQDARKSRHCKHAVAELVKDKRVKKVIDTGGKVVNLGCTAKTEKCNETAHFDHGFNTRVNTPPCCREKLLELLRHVTKAFQRIHVSHFLVFGSVLGWTRNNEMIPYDQDMDLVVDGLFWNTTLFFKIFERLETKFGHRIEYRDGGFKLWVSYSDTNKNILDIWPYFVEETETCSIVSIPHDVWRDQPLSVIFPLRFVNFSGIWTYVPRDPIRYLDSFYEDWHDELDCKYKRDEKCVPPPKPRKKDTSGKIGYPAFHVTLALVATLNLACLFKGYALFARKYRQTL